MKNRSPLAALLIFAGLLALHLQSPAQLVIGQYEDEAPLRSWNIFGFQTAPSLGRGDTSFALASDSSVALTNPALLLDLTGFTVTFNGTNSSTALYRYSIVNTGVLTTDGSFSLGLSALDFGGFSYSYKGWAVAMTVSLSEIYDRPQAYAEYLYQGILYYSMDFNQTGLLRNFNFALARSFGKIFQAGIGLNFVRGKIDRETEEQRTYDNITFRDRKEQDFSGFYLNGGILVRPSKKWNLALVFRTPYTKESPGTSVLRYEAPGGGTDIKIEASATNLYEQPLVVGLGACYEFNPRLKMTTDVAYFNWSRYRVDYFEEEQERDFKNTLKAGLGSEYSYPLQLLKQSSFLLLRLGLGFDQQPMREMNSSYVYFALGSGLQMKNFSLDFGYSYGRENGSGASLTSRRLALALTGRF